MSICRFVAREANIAGRNSLEAAMVDEIVDVVQDAIEANVRAQNPKQSHNAWEYKTLFQYKAWYSPNRREELVKLTGQTFPTTLVCDQKAKKCEKRRRKLSVFRPS